MNGGQSGVAERAQGSESDDLHSFWSPGVQHIMGLGTKILVS